MNPPPETPDLDTLLEEAIAWVVHLKTGEPTQGDVEAFKRWRDQSPAHMDAFKRAAQINQRAGIIADRLEPASPPTSRPWKVSRRAVLGGGLAAAAAAAYGIIQPPMGLWPSLGELSADYRTAKGENRTINLVQGVSLDLNTQTSLALRSGQNRPTVELLSGEVLANARRSASDGLVVLAGNGRIEAVNAQFNAKNIEGAVSVTCLDGFVDVQCEGKSARLGKDQQILYSRLGLGPSVGVDPGQITAWQSGLLIFRDRPLANVVDEVNRYRSGKIVIITPELRQRTVSGDFEIAKLDAFVTQVQQLFGAHATALPGGIVILS